MKRIQKYKKISKYWSIYNNQKNKLKFLINQKRSECEEWKKI